METEPAGEPDRDLCAVVLIDVVGSATATRLGELRMRQDLYDVVHGALRRRGFGLDSFLFNDIGDGLRLVIPFHRLRPTEIVDMFVLGLIAELRQHRRYASEAARIRMRVAVDMGLVEPHLRGWAGGPLVRAARLIDAQPLHEVLGAHPDLDLAVMVSDAMYQSVVRPGGGYVAPDCFRPIRVRVKEFDAMAWLLAPYGSWLCGSFHGAAA